MAKNKEERLLEYFMEPYLSGKPNPKRKGCPEAKELRAIAFRQYDGGMEKLMKITEHLENCSECVRDSEKFVSEYKEQKKQEKKSKKKD